MTGPTARLDAPDELVRFADALRRAGVGVGVGQTLELARSLRALSTSDHDLDRDDLYWAARTTLVVDHRDLPAFDAVFAAFFLDVAEGGGAARDERPLAELRAGTAPQREDAERESGEDAELVGGVASELEILRTRRFDRATPEELHAMRALMRRIELDLPRRRTRRRVPWSRQRGPVDLRRSAQRALQTDGEIVARVHRRRRVRPRRLVLLLDVSGSMAGFSRALLQFAWSARARTARAGGRGWGGRSIEVFAFGTRLTRLTDQLAGRAVDAALDEASAAVVDWDGGTRIGAAVGELNRRWARRGLTRGAVVLIVSDGLERGGVDELADEMARLRRTAHRIVWVNPLKGDPRYEPLARGMRAALPHVDRLVSGHDLASLDELAAVIGELDDRRPTPRTVPFLREVRA